MATTDGAIEDFTTSDGAIRGLNSLCVVIVSFVS